MSSTEAELMALADLALEMLYVRSVLTHLGHDFADESVLETAKPEAHKLLHKTLEAKTYGQAAPGRIWHDKMEAGTDNSGAHAICNRETVTSNARHIERKEFKMRELKLSKSIHVTLVPTAENAADMFTKALDTKTFQRHRKEVMNLVV